MQGNRFVDARPLQGIPEKGKPVYSTFLGG